MDGDAVLRFLKSEQEDERVLAWERIAKHPFFVPCYDAEEPLIDAMLHRLDTVAEQQGVMTPDQLAERFHEAYERLAPQFGYRTRDASAVPWSDVPENNKALMTAVAAEILALLKEH